MCQAEVTKIWNKSVTGAVIWQSETGVMLQFFWATMYPIKVGKDITRQKTKWSTFVPPCARMYFLRQQNSYFRLGKYAGWKNYVRHRVTLKLANTLRDFTVFICTNYGCTTQQVHFITGKFRLAPACTSFRVKLAQFRTEKTSDPSFWRQCQKFHANFLTRETNFWPDTDHWISGENNYWLTLTSVALSPKTILELIIYF